MNSRTLFLGLIKVRFRGLFKSHSLTKWPPSVWDQGKLLIFFFSVCGAPSRLHSAQGACCGITLTFNLRPTSIYMNRRFTHDCEPTPTQKWPVTHTRDTRTLSLKWYVNVFVTGSLGGTTKIFVREIIPEESETAIRYHYFSWEWFSLSSLLDNNPLECDCRITPSLWTAKVTGSCAHPPHLRGVEVSTLYIEDFRCG